MRVWMRSTVTVSLNLVYCVVVRLLTVVVATVRSEGGAECRKIQKEMKPPGEEDGPLGASGLTMKEEPDAKWNGGGVMV